MYLSIVLVISPLFLCILILKTVHTDASEEVNRMAVSCNNNDDDDDLWPDATPDMTFMFSNLN